MWLHICDSEVPTSDLTVTESHFLLLHKLGARGREIKGKKEYHTLCLSVTEGALEDETAECHDDSVLQHSQTAAQYVPFKYLDICYM